MVTALWADLTDERPVGPVTSHYVVKVPRPKGSHTAAAAAREDVDYMIPFQKSSWKLAPPVGDNS